jgi:hypothetical protein
MHHFSGRSGIGRDRPTLFEAIRAAVSECGAGEASCELYAIGYSLEDVVGHGMSLERMLYTREALQKRLAYFLGSSTWSDIKAVVGDPESLKYFTAFARSSGATGRAVALGAGGRSLKKPLWMRPRTARRS